MFKYIEERVLLARPEKKIIFQNLIIDLCTVTVIAESGAWIVNAGRPVVNWIDAGLIS